MSEAEISTILRRLTKQDDLLNRLSSDVSQLKKESSRQADRKEWFLRMTVNAFMIAIATGFIDWRLDKHDKSTIEPPASEVHPSQPMPVKNQ